MQWLKNYCYRRFRTSFAKAGEDLQVFQLLKQKSKGIFVDIGSHHPIKGSNSFFFYLRGWTGLCVDPNPDFKPLYGKIRPNDIFLNIGISDEQGSLEYYKLKDKLSARNSFSKEYIDKNNLNDDVEQIYRIQVKPLKDILHNEMAGKQIDFLTIDVEGLDLQVLKGNDWNKHRPSIICVESHLQLHEDIQSSTTKYMTDKDYVLFGKTMQGEQVGTLFYKPT